MQTTSNVHHLSDRATLAGLAEQPFMEGLIHAWASNGALRVIPDPEAPARLTSRAPR